MHFMEEIQFLEIEIILCNYKELWIQFAPGGKWSWNADLEVETAAVKNSESFLDITGL